MNFLKILKIFLKPSISHILVSSLIPNKINILTFKSCQSLFMHETLAYFSVIAMGVRFHPTFFIGCNWVQDIS